MPRGRKRKAAENAEIRVVEVEKEEDDDVIKEVKKLRKETEGIRSVLLANAPRFDPRSSADFITEMRSIQSEISSFRLQIDRLSGKMGKMEKRLDKMERNPQNFPIREAIVGNWRFVREEDLSAKNGNDSYEYRDKKRSFEEFAPRLQNLEFMNNANNRLYWSFGAAGYGQWKLLEKNAERGNIITSTIENHRDVYNATFEIINGRLCFCLQTGAFCIRRIYQKV